ncbi:MAG TPA: hypothetical protein VM925_01290, partial [Labilithrix sp.]|nr:hypothetical protein [Labilithrix sp.]
MESGIRVTERGLAEPRVVHRGGRFVIERSGDGGGVVVKTVSDKTRTDSAASLRHEFDILERLA